MKFSDVVVLNERIEDRYVHNTNINGLYKILENGYIKGTRQNDHCSKNSGSSCKPELCVSRSDMIPQNTGANLSTKMLLGNLIKIQLKMNNITNGKLNIKKPYPISYGNFKANEMIRYSLEDLLDLLDKYGIKENYKDIENLKDYFLNRDSYDMLKRTKDRRFNLTKEKFFSTLDKVNKNKYIKHRIDIIKKTYNNFEKYNPEMSGEERLEMENKKIPVSSKYMTINIPEELWNNSTIQKYIKQYNDPELFKMYKDSSEKANERVGNKWD